MSICPVGRSSRTLTRVREDTGRGVGERSFSGGLRSGGQDDMRAVSLEHIVVSCVASGVGERVCHFLLVCLG